MKKQSGFTLIELMVVMAIIAILATAGLSAYTGYIKKARDTTRIADLDAINTIVISTMSVSGMAPTKTELEAAILAANNNKEILDPLMNPTTYASKMVCFVAADNKPATGDLDYCYYTYQLCDSGTGYILTAQFESPSNVGLYDDDLAGPGGASAALFTYIEGTYSIGQSDTYDIGSCQSSLDTPEDAALFYNS